jgi:uncharacterized protein YciI
MPVYVYLMDDQNPLSPTIISKHIEHLQQLESENRLIICGPFSDYKGGMVVFNAADKEEAMRITLRDPFIALGFKTFELRTLDVADASNDYLG